MKPSIIAPLTIAVSLALAGCQSDNIFEVTTQGVQEKNDNKMISQENPFLKEF